MNALTGSVSDNPREVEGVFYWRGLGPCATKAANFLINGKVGDVVTRKKMAEITGFPCDRPDTKEGRNALNNVRSAIRRVEQENRIVWGWINNGSAPGVWKCLDDNEKFAKSRGLSTQGIKRIQRSNHTAACVNEDNLNADEKTSLKLLTIQNSMALTSLSSHLTKRLSSATQDNLRAVDYDRLAQLLESSTPSK